MPARPVRAASEAARAPCQPAAPPAPRAVLHPLVDGKPSCVSAWFSFPCPHHPGEHHARPELCGRQACESSTQDNTLERGRDAWEGTADRSARGLRHFGDVEWAVFIFTLPAELRARAQGDDLRRFRKAAGEMALEVLRTAAGDERARFFARSWLHPEGDEEPGVYKPHENVIVPLVAFHPVRWAVSCRRAGGQRHPRYFSREKNALAYVAGRARPEEWCVEKVKGFKKRLRFTLPRSWLGEEGWICERWRARLVKLFGQWWSDAERAPATLPFYEFRRTPEQKKHALRYFARTFPAWAQHPAVPLRPRALDAAHWKNRLMAPYDVERKLPAWDACEKCVAAGEEPPPRVAGFGATPAAASAAAAAGVEEHCCANCHRDEFNLGRPYLEHRRIMAIQNGRVFTHQPTGPPLGEPSLAPGTTPEPLAVVPLSGAAFAARAERYAAYADSWQFLLDHPEGIDLRTGEVVGAVHSRPLDLPMSRRALAALRELDRDFSSGGTTCKVLD